jgi:hypothetical protein
MQETETPQHQLRTVSTGDERAIMGPWVRASPTIRMKRGELPTIFARRSGKGCSLFVSLYFSRRSLHLGR